MIRNFMAEDQGATVVEYGLLICLGISISIVGVIMLTFIGVSIKLIMS